jgi:type I restriction enzyme, S subunit
LEEGDLLFARSSLKVEGTGKCSFVQSLPEVTTFESHLIRARLDRTKADPRFYFYFFQSYHGRATVLSIAKQVGAAGLPGSKLAGLSVPQPVPTIQSRTADILSTYDDLIENNRRRMALLEEAARQLYREWFVRLRFPGHEHTRITNGVPEGWERKMLGDLAAINRQSLGSLFDGEIEYVDISSVTPGQIDGTSTFDFREAPSRARRIVQHGDIIWSCVRPNRRSYAVIWQPPPNLIVSTGFAVITPTALPPSFIYQATTTDAFVGYLENHARGAAYPAVVASDFARAEILVPPRPLVQSYNDFAEPVFEQANNLRLQNQKLRTARDLLLPRLMNGAIKV